MKTIDSFMKRVCTDPYGDKLKILNAFEEKVFSIIPKGTLVSPETSETAVGFLPTSVLYPIKKELEKIRRNESTQLFQSRNHRQAIVVVGHPCGILSWEKSVSFVIVSNGNFLVGTAKNHLGGKIRISLHFVVESRTRGLVLSERKIEVSSAILERAGKIIEQNKDTSTVNGLTNVRASFVQSQAHFGIVDISIRSSHKNASVLQEAFHRALDVLNLNLEAGSFGVIHETTKGVLSTSYTIKSMILPKKKGLFSFHGSICIPCFKDPEKGFDFFFKSLVKAVSVGRCEVRNQKIILGTDNIPIEDYRDLFCKINPQASGKALHQTPSLQDLYEIPEFEMASIMDADGVPVAVDERGDEPSDESSITRPGLESLLARVRRTAEPLQEAPDSVHVSFRNELQSQFNQAVREAHEGDREEAEAPW